MQVQDYVIINRSGSLEKESFFLVGLYHVGYCERPDGLDILIQYFVHDMTLHKLLDK